MNTIEEFVQYQQTKRKWSVRQYAHRAYLRVRRMFKRRLRGESHRQWIERNLNDSEAGLWFDMLQVFVSMVMVLSIITQNWSRTNFVRPQSYEGIDFANLAMITINFGVRYFSAGDRKAFCLHWLSIADGFCWIALLVELILPNDDSRQSKYEYRFFLLMRTSRLVQVFRLRRLTKTAKARQGMLIALTGLCILIGAAAAFQTIEYCDTSRPQYVSGVNCQDLSFFESVYFVCITIGTVGFGEYAPKSNMGKLAAIFLIIFTGVLIPTQISGLTEILSRETAFDKKYTPDKRVQHVLLCGDIENASLNFFLHSWLHGDGERGNRRKVIILSPTLPTSSVRRVLIHRDYEQRVLYLQGSAMDANDLQRAGAQTAAYCFVMVKKHSASQDEDDTAANLVTCSIRKNNRHAPLYVQVSKPDNVRHVNISGASAVVCIEQLKLSLLAKSLWIRGLNAFLGNLVQRFDVVDAKGGFWLKDYVGGCGQRIFEASVPSFLFTMPTFRSLAMLIYREFNVSMIGIRTLQEAVIVYPVDKDINDVGFHSVFFLSSSRETVSKIEKLTSAVFLRHQDISPSVDLSSGKSNRTVTGVMSAISAKPFQRLSSLVMTDRHADSLMNTARGGDDKNTVRGGNDKITPLDTGDDGNESDTAPRSPKRGRISSVKPRAVPHTRSDDRDEEYERRLESERDLSDPPYVPPTQPVVALTPAQLMKKATGPLSPRDPVAKPLITPRSPRATSPRRSEPPSGSKTSRSQPASPRSSLGPSFANTRQAEENGVGLPCTTNHIEGPQLSEIQAACLAAPVENEPLQSVESAEDRNDRTELLNSFSPLRRDGPPVLRRSSSKRDQQRIGRSSKYRSFRRRAPPSTLAGHFVVCGLPSNYSSLIRNLTDLDEAPTPVVFVTPGELSEKDFSTYIEFREVYFVRGSPVSMETFEEARMVHAKSILITSYCGQAAGDDNQNDTKQFDENMADVDAITTHRFISEACQNHSQKPTTLHGLVTKLHRQSAWQAMTSPYIVVEMMRPSNVKFLVDRSGSLYDEKSEVNEIRARDLLRDAHALDDAFFSPLYAGGNVYFSNFMDALLGSTSQNSFLIDMITQLVISGNTGLNQADREARSRNRLSQIPAPVRYHNRPFALLVEGLLVNENTIALGVYRAGHGFIAPAYVITSPAPNELIHAQDLIFVIK